MSADSVDRNTFQIRVREHKYWEFRIRFPAVRLRKFVHDSWVIHNSINDSQKLFDFLPINLLCMVNYFCCYFLCRRFGFCSRLETVCESECWLSRCPHRPHHPQRFVHFTPMLRLAVAVACVVREKTTRCDAERERGSSFIGFHRGLVVRSRESTFLFSPAFTTLIFCSKVKDLLSSFVVLSKNNEAVDVYQRAETSQMGDVWDMRCCVSHFSW